MNVFDELLKAMNQRGEKKLLRLDVVFYFNQIGQGGNSIWRKGDA